MQVARRDIRFNTRFFKKLGFLEMQTPALVKCAGQEPYLPPMKLALADDKNKKVERVSN